MQKPGDIVEIVRDHTETTTFALYTKWVEFAN